MSFTQADLTSVENAILKLATGESIVKVSLSNGQQIEYSDATLGDLKNLRNNIRAEVRLGLGVGFISLEPKKDCES